jgi:hypothetical protein
VCQVGYLQDLYQDARSAKHEIKWKTLNKIHPKVLREFSDLLL